MTGYGTSETNGDDARRSACGGKPDIARIIVEGRILVQSDIGLRGG
jgi:hypothetical protein